MIRIVIENFCSEFLKPVNSHLIYLNIFRQAVLKGLEEVKKTAQTGVEECQDRRMSLVDNQWAKIAKTFE